MVKKGLQHLFFWILLLLGIGQLPSVIGKGFLFLSLLVFPNSAVQRFVREMLSNCARPWFWFLLFFLYLRYVPLTQVHQAGESMGRFLRGIADWICYLVET